MVTCFKSVDVDLESGKVMDETRHLLHVYRNRSMTEIERRNRQVTAQVFPLGGS